MSSCSTMVLQGQSNALAAVITRGKIEYNWILMRKIEYLFLIAAAATVAATMPYNYYEFAVQNWVNGTYQVHGLWPA
jgi:hypothetical protein